MKNKWIITNLGEAFKYLANRGNFDVFMICDAYRGETARQAGMREIE